MKIAGFWRPLSDIASIFHHEGHEGHEGEEGEEGETSLFVLFVLFVVNSMPTINRRWSEGFLTSWVTRSVSGDCYENRVGSGGLSLILLRSFTTKDTKDTKERKEKPASSCSSCSSW